MHIVGGGARNELLCQLTADACGLPVEAGPVEAGALGNALVQARALGAVGPDLDALRSLVRATQPIRRYEPRRRPGRHAAAARIYRMIITTWEVMTNDQSSPSAPAGPAPPAAGAAAPAESDRAPARRRA